MLCLAGTAQASPEGFELLEAWQLEDAAALADAELLRAPDDPRVWILQGHVLYQLGEHEAALQFLEAAGAEDAEVGYVYERVRDSAAYAAQYATLDTEHFRIRYLNKDEIVATYAAPILEAAYARIGGALEFLPAERGTRIVVEILPDAQALAGSTGLTVKEIATSGTIAVCKFHRLMITSPLAAANGYGWADTLAHEFTHLVISKKSHNNVPIWLHEGIAKYYESLWHKGAGAALESYGEALLAKAVQKNKLITFAQMHPSMAKLPSQEDASLAFAEVFTTIEFMNQRFGPASVPRLLALLGQGVPFERALKQVFKLDLKGIEAAWQRYLKGRKFQLVPGAARQTIVLTSSETESQAARPLETMEDKEAHDYARLGELLQLRGNTPAAVIEYEKAHAKGGSRYPTLNYRLASAYADSNQIPKALALLDATLAVHGDATDLHLLAGRLRFKGGELAAAGSHFDAARLRNPFNPDIHVALAKLHEARGEQQAAERERRFAELATKPRPTRTYARPTTPAGNARVSIKIIGASGFRLDGGAPVVALWNFPVASGTHSIEYMDAQAQGQTRTFDVAADGHKRWVFAR